MCGAGRLANIASKNNCFCPYLLFAAAREGRRFHECLASGRSPTAKTGSKEEPGSDANRTHITHPESVTNDTFLSHSLQISSCSRRGLFSNLQLSLAYMLNLSVARMDRSGNRGLLDIYFPGFLPCGPVYPGSSRTRYGLDADGVTRRFWDNFCDRRVTWPYTRCLHTRRLGASVIVIE